MKRMHVHVHVEDLERSIGFYAALFGGEPSVRKGDYAKWMLDDPRVNFAISTAGGSRGIAHLGIQFEDGAGLDALSARMRDSGVEGIEQKDAACCYARSDKSWMRDPQGVVWENFVSLGQIEEFGDDRFSTAAVAESEACCASAD